MPPLALSPNLAAIKYQNTNHAVGSVVAASPLLPTPLMREDLPPRVDDSGRSWCSSFRRLRPCR